MAGERDSGEGKDGNPYSGKKVETQKGGRGGGG